MREDLASLRIALAHDYLTQRGGAERVMLHLCNMYPDASIYSSVYSKDITYPEFQQRVVKTTFLQRSRLFRRDPRLALAVLPYAWDSLLIDECDAVIVSSSGWAHGVVAPEGVPKIVYCHNPARWLYQSDTYATTAIERLAIGALRPMLTRWDKRAARSAHTYIANSSLVAQRIRKTYGIEAPVVFPPTSLSAADVQSPIEGLKPGFWLTVSRDRGYKNVDAVAKAVTRLRDGQLVVVGRNPPSQNSFDPRYVTFVGKVSDAQLRWLYANARALVTLAFEDFGLTPIEANTFGTPVAALRAGGHLDSIAEGVSGWWIEEPTEAATVSALKKMPAFDEPAIVTHARSFAPELFSAQISKIVLDAVANRARA